MTVIQRVLVADDHGVTRRGVRELLHDIFPGAEVAEVEDVPSLYDSVRESRWDLLLLDILMPGGNVIEVLQSVRSIDPAVPVLMITAATELEYVIQSMKAGANGLIHKHRAVDDLQEAIRKVAAGETYLDSETAIEIARNLHDEKPTLPHHKLSERELDVMRRVALGRAVKEIGGDLDISPKTVATYLARIREKTGLSNYVEITRYALQNGLVD